MLRGKTVFLTVLCIGIFLCFLCGIQENPYNTYSLQAARWLAGHLDLGQNYAHLEIAQYGGKFYASFPPFPSVVLLPFVVLFGTNTPDAFLSILLAAWGAFLAYKIALFYKKDEKEAMFWALFLTLGSNFCSIFFEGWVWFFAQTLSFTLSLGAVYAALYKKPRLTFLLIMAAAGCRQFQILYLPFLIALLRTKEAPVPWEKMLFSVWPSFFLGLFYMVLNVVRFGSPFEFGHNFLPEFLAEAQFSLSYLPQNIWRLFRLPGFENGVFAFPKFDGFAFYLVSPIFMVYFSALCKGKPKKRDFLLLGLCLLHLIFLCLHRTMGGWHFGNRYTIDLLPFVFPGIMRLQKTRLAKPLSTGLLLFGFLLNAAGIWWLLTAG